MLRFIIILYHDRQSTAINDHEPIQLGTQCHVDHSLKLRWHFIEFFLQICIQDFGCSVHRRTIRKLGSAISEVISETFGSMEGPFHANFGINRLNSFKS